MPRCVVKVVNNWLWPIAYTRLTQLSIVKAPLSKTCRLSKMDNSPPYILSASSDANCQASCRSGRRRTIAVRQAYPLSASIFPPQWSKLSTAAMHLAVEKSGMRLYRAGAGKERGRSWVRMTIELPPTPPSFDRFLSLPPTSVIWIPSFYFRRRPPTRFTADPIRRSERWLSRSSDLNAASHGPSTDLKRVLSAP